MHNRRDFNPLSHAYTLQALQNPNHASTLPLHSSLPQLQDESCWRTNLMLDSQVDRVHQRNQLFRKRTSFEEHLINDHLKQMKKILTATGLAVIEQKMADNDKQFQIIKQNKKIEEIQTNNYLTEQQKWQLSELLLGNQQNFSIFCRLSSILQQNKEELVYLLCQIINFVTIQLPLKKGLNCQRQNINTLIESHRQQLMDKVMSQQMIKIINPLFFSNENEQPLMEIVNNWFYNILCVKHGVYEQLAMDLQGQIQTNVEEEQEDLFM